MAQGKAPQRRRKTARERWSQDVGPRGKSGIGIDLDVQVYPDGAVYLIAKGRNLPTANAAQACGAFAELIDFMIREAAKKKS